MTLTVPAAFASAVREHGTRPALVVEDDGSSLSYQELDALRLEAASALLATGIQPGDRVALWAPNSVEWVVAGLATLTIGAVLVPVNTRMRADEAGYVLSRSGARVLFCAGDFLGQHYPSLLTARRPKSLTTLVVIGEPRSDDFAWRHFLARAGGRSIDAVLQRSQAISPDDAMDILFTSGTTGHPKGVITRHGQNLRAIGEWSQRMQLAPEDRYLVVNPFFHAFGYKVGWLAGLLCGCSVLPHAVFDAKAVLRRIANERVSVLPGPPTLFTSLLDDEVRAGLDLSSLRATVTGAATIAPALIERIRQELGFRIVLTGYGLTEACGIVSLCSASDDASTVALTSGRALPGVELRCVDASGQALAPGVAGEILVRGYNVMQGYLDDPDATREAIDPEGWLHTGDIGCLDANGYLRITDRLKDMYITGGFNCYPAEIERMIAAHPAVAQVAVVGVPDERLGEVGRACLVLRAQAALDVEAFLAWCRERMANYKVPREVEVMNALPISAAGKILKYRLREEALALRGAVS
jgi:acyl-CoA synthetase (AMP-forming)/AMP-acid ligase II